MSRFLIALAFITLGVACGSGAEPGSNGSSDPTPTAPTDPTPTLTPEQNPYVGTGCEDNVSWRAERDPVTGRLTSSVWITSEAEAGCQQDRSVVLGLYCSPRLRVIILKTRVHQESHEVTWQINGGAPVTEDWTPANWDSPGDFRPPVSGAMLEKLKSASRFTITTAAMGEIVFDLDEALDAPALPNIINCGRDGWR